MKPTQLNTILFYIADANKSLVRVLESMDYNPDSATYEEQIIAGMIAQLLLLEKSYTKPESK